MVSKQKLDEVALDARKEASEIVSLCNAAGKAHLAYGFIERKCSLATVKAALAAEPVRQEPDGRIALLAAAKRLAAGSRVLTGIRPVMVARWHKPFSFIGKK
jgi:hypothetical protein